MKKPEWVVILRGSKVVSRNRAEKFMPGGIGGKVVSVDKSEDGRITRYRWSESPVELWIWDFNVGGYGGSQIELHGLEHYPSRRQLEPALAMLMGMREYHRRKSGEMAGPGRKSKWGVRLTPWKESGYNPDVLAELRQKYLDQDPDHRLATFNRAARRWKRKWEHENT